MPNLSEKKLLGLTIGVAVLLTGVLLFLVYQDRTEVDSVEREISALDTRLHVAEAECRKIPKREDKVLQFRAVEPRELAVLPTEQLISDFHRQLSGFLSSAGMKFRELPESSPEDSELAKGIRVTRNRIKGLGDSSSILKFMNMIENDPRLVAIKGFKIQAGEPDRDDPDAAILHEVEIELETYHYRPGRGGIDRVHIPGAEARLQDRDLRAEIAAFQPERPDSYVLHPAVGRRDPLVDPRRARESVDPAALQAQFEAEEAALIKLENLYREIAELLEKEKALERAGDLFRLDRIRRELATRINTLLARMEQVRVTRKVTIPALEARLDVLAENLTRVRSGRDPKEVVVTLVVARNVVEELRELFEKGKYEEIEATGQSWMSFVRSKTIMAEAQPLLDEIKRLRERAETLAAFRAMAFEIAGRIIDKQTPENSVVRVNGQYLRQGDAADNKGHVTILEIRADVIVFGFKGEKIRRSAKRPKKAGKRSDEKKSRKRRRK